MQIRQLRRLVSLIAIGLLWTCAKKDPLAADQNPIAFVHAHLVPMTTETVLPDHTVIVEGSWITAVGTSSETSIPTGVTVVDCKDGFLMPGLADMHMHLRTSWLGDAWPISPLKLYLANGVTTIRCFGPRGKNGRYALAWRKQIKAGDLDGPSILTCGRQLRGHFKEDPQHIVIRQKYLHFDFVKIYSYVTRQEYQTILSSSGKLKFYTAGHIPFQVGLDGVLAQGMNEIAHIEELLWEFSDMDRERYFKSESAWMDYAIQTTFRRLSPLLALGPREREGRIEQMALRLAAKFKDHPVPPFCTTLVIDDLIVQKLVDPEGFLERPENRYLPTGYLESFRSGLDKHQLQFKDAKAFARLKYLLDTKLLSALKAVPIPLLLSTDAGTGTMGAVPGFSLHDELRILVENGFSPYEALAAGTVVASKIVQRMNGRDDFGTIVPGKRADLLLVARNPLDDVANAGKIRGVMAAGRWYDQKAITQLLNQDQF